MQALFKTGNKKLVEYPKDTLWGTGVLQNEPDCLNEKYWKSQGILGEIPQKIQHKHLQIVQSILPAINQWHLQGPPPLIHPGVEPCKLSNATVINPVTAATPSPTTKFPQIAADQQNMGTTEPMQTGTAH